MELMFIIGVERHPEQCVVQRIVTDNGKYLIPRTYKFDLNTQIKGVSLTILKERPNKIIFDEFGDGYVFKDCLENYLRRDHGIVILESGDVVY